MSMTAASYPGSMARAASRATAPEATAMFREAAEASAAVARQLAANHGVIARLGETLRRRRPRLALTCARGSSDHAATLAKYLIETRAGAPTVSAAPSVNSVYGSDMALDGAVFLAISQSGRSPDLIAAADAARRAGALVVALVNVDGSPLAAAADWKIPLRAGPETSVAATKSFIASLAAILHLVGEWTEDQGLLDELHQAPDVLAEAWRQDWSPAVEVLAEARDLYVLGRGPGLGVAQEAALKFKETCGLHAEAFSSAEVRHGPLALVGAGFPVLVLSQDDESREGVDEMAADMAVRGARLLLAGARSDLAVNLPVVRAPAVLQPLAMIQSFYRMANALSLARGYDPDRPPHLAKVTQTL